MKYWHALLHEWREIGRDGFTIPFIIGSQNFLAENDNRQDIFDLVSEIVENDNTEIYISYCMNINDLIIGIRDDRKKKIAGYFPNLNSINQNQFFLTSFVNDLGSSIEEIIESLRKKYDNQIEEQNYSINDRQLGNFSDREKKFITETFKKYRL